jgi:uncharacterized alkaline shock family protein YloU
MPEEQKLRGRIDVSPAAIATLVNEAAMRSYGVVGTAPRDLTSGIVSALSPDNKGGISVRIDDDGQIHIDVHVIIEYGTRIFTVAQSLMNIVKFTVERALGVAVREVNVHVEGLRVSDID